MENMAEISKIFLTLMAYQFSYISNLILTQKNNKMRRNENEMELNEIKFSKDQYNYQ